MKEKILVLYYSRSFAITFGTILKEMDRMCPVLGTSRIVYERVCLFPSPVYLEAAG